MIFEELDSKWKELARMGLQPVGIFLGPKEYLQLEIEINHRQEIDPKKVYALIESGTCRIDSMIGQVIVYLSSTPGIHFEFKRADLPKISGQ